jgi:uncharacterized UPF0160 family protein
MFINHYCAISYSEKESFDLYFLIQFLFFDDNKLQRGRSKFIVVLESSYIVNVSVNYNTQVITQTLN